jgi:Protein of unknown function (DUF3293)
MEISKELKTSYLATHYCVILSDAVLVIRVGQTSPELKNLMAEHSAAGAVFITAWNPSGVVSGAPENNSANEKLKKGLDEIAAVVLPGYGSSPDGNWREESFLALPVSRHEATELCSRYAQNAVLFIDSSGVPELIFHPDL